MAEVEQDAYGDGPGGQLSDLGSLHEMVTLLLEGNTFDTAPSVTTAKPHTSSERKGPRPCDRRVTTVYLLQ